MYRLQNEWLSLGVLPEGAELCSIKSLENNREYVWQADPAIWGSHAPNLFPIIGALKDDSYILDNVNYNLPKHGFVRNNKNLKLINSSDSELIFSLYYSEETLKMYPFKFEFQIKYTLKEKEICISHKVFNHGENDLYFSLGGHPAFNLPISDNTNLEDYFLEFDEPMDLETQILTKDGLIGNETKTVLKGKNKIQLHESIFDNDALIFKNILSKKVKLSSKEEGPILEVAFSDFNNLGIWAKPAAPYVCIEPWLGIADYDTTDQNFKTKDGILKLEASKQFEATYTISIL